MWSFSHSALDLDSHGSATRFLGDRRRSQGSNLSKDERDPSRPNRGSRVLSVGCGLKTTPDCIAALDRAASMPPSKPLFVFIPHVLIQVAHSKWLLGRGGGRS